MASQKMPSGTEKILNGQIALSTDNLKFVCVDLADYTFSAAHTALSDIPVGARVATSGNITGKTYTGGVFSCAVTNVPNVTGDQFEGMYLYKDSGVAATSWLIDWWDTATGLPFTPNGSGVDITPNASGLANYQ